MESLNKKSPGRSSQKFPPNPVVLGGRSWKICVMMSAWKPRSLKIAWRFGEWRLFGVHGYENDENKLKIDDFVFIFPYFFYIFVLEKEA